MNKNFKKDAKLLVELLGGKSNISVATHCMTRIRLVLKDTKLANVKEIEKLESVKGTFTAQGQFQVIIGPEVSDFFILFSAAGDIKSASKDDVKSEVTKQGNWWQRTMSVFAEIFVPLIPVIVAGGLILAFRNILELDWGNGSLVNSNSFWSSLNAILWIPANAVFWYLPVGIVWSIFNRKNKAPALGIVIGIMLVSPSILANFYGISGSIGQYLLSGDIMSNVPTTGDAGVLLGSGTHSLDSIIFALQARGEVISNDATWVEVNAVLESIGISGSYYISNIFKAIDANNAYYFSYWPLALSYVGQVIPALLVGVASLWFFEFIEKHTWSPIRYVWPPFAVIIFALFMGHGVIGPIGATASYGVTYVFQWAFTDSVAKYFFGPLFGLLYGPIVITGLHHTFNAVMLELTTVGANYIFPMLALSNLAQGAAVFGIVWLARNDEKTKETGISAGVTGWLGVTEPAMFGFNLKYLFPFVAAMVASAIGSTLVVAFDITAAGIGMGGILGFLNIDNVLGSLPQWSAWLIYWAIMIITVVASFQLTIVFSKMSHRFKKFATADWDEFIELANKKKVNSKK